MFELKNIPQIVLVSFLLFIGTAFGQQNELASAAGLIQNGNFAEAEVVLLRVKTAAPGNSDARNLLGIVYDQTGRTADAEKEYREAIRLKPNAVSPRANLGILLARSTRRREAVAVMQSVLKLDPRHPQTLINIGLVHSALGEYGAALGFLEKAIVLQPDNPDIMMNFGIALFHNKRSDDSKIVLEKLAVMRPGAQVFYYLGLIDTANLQNQNASVNFRRSLTFDPTFSDAHFMLGELAAKENRLAEALGHYLAALTENRTRDVYFIRIGGIYLLNKEFEKAAEYFRPAAGLFPNVPEIQYFLAVTERGLGNFEAAEKHIKRSLELKETTDSLALFATMLLDKNKTNEAELLYRKALTKNPKHFNSNFELGKLLVKQQKFAAALIHLQNAEAMKTGNPDVHYQLYLTLSRLKRKPEADAQFALFKAHSERKN